MYMDAVVWKVNARVVGSLLEQLGVNRERFDINQRLQITEHCIYIYKVGCEWFRETIDLWVCLVEYVKEESFEREYVIVE